MTTAAWFALFSDQQQQRIRQHGSSAVSTVSEPLACEVSTLTLDRPRCACGWIIDARSSICRACAGAKRRVRHPKRCGCGAWIQWKATRCKSCAAIQMQPTKQAQGFHGGSRRRRTAA